MNGLSTQGANDGCAICKRGVLIGSPPSLVSVDVAAHTHLRRCDLCGTWWEETERESHILVDPNVYPALTAYFEWLGRLRDAGWHLERWILQTDPHEALAICKGDHGLFRYEQLKWSRFYEPSPEDRGPVHGGLWGSENTSGLYQTLDEALAASVNHRSKPLD